MLIQNWLRRGVTRAPASALALCVACASDGSTDDAGEEEDPIVEACEHMEDGPNATHLAAQMAPYADVTAEHTRHDVTLIDDGGQNGGSVIFESGEAVDYLVFLDRDTPLAFFDASLASLPIEDSVNVTSCDAVAVQKTVEFPVGTVELRFGPTSETTVRLVIEEAHGMHDD